MCSSDLHTFFNSIKKLVDEAFNFGSLNPDENGENQFFGHGIGSILDLAKMLATNVIDEDASIEDLESIAANAFGVTDTLLRFGKPWGQLPQGDRTRTFDCHRSN